MMDQISETCQVFFTAQDYAEVIFKNMFVIYKCLKLPGGVFQNQGREFYLYLADT
jgi:hypothetical protein